MNYVFFDSLPTLLQLRIFEKFSKFNEFSIYAHNVCVYNSSLLFPHDASKKTIVIQKYEERPQVRFHNVQLLNTRWILNDEFCSTILKHVKNCNVLKCTHEITCSEEMFYKFTKALKIKFIYLEHVTPPFAYDVSHVDCVDVSPFCDFTIDEILSIKTKSVLSSFRGNPENVVDCLQARMQSRKRIPSGKFGGQFYTLENIAEALLLFGDHFKPIPSSLYPTWIINDEKRMPAIKVFFHEYCMCFEPIS